MVPPSSASLRLKARDYSSFRKENKILTFLCFCVLCRYLLKGWCLLILKASIDYYDNFLDLTDTLRKHTSPLIYVTHNPFKLTTIIKFVLYNEVHFISVTFLPFFYLMLYHTILLDPLLLQVLGILPHAACL